jgi:hypothetical protein
MSLGGNRAITSFGAANIQRKLTVGETNDPMEHQADDMADKVMRMPERPLVQRQADNTDDEDIKRKPLSGPIPPFIQAKGDGGGVVSPAVTNGIKATQGDGKSMDGSTKSFMESRFGIGFNDVKIHNGAKPAQLSQTLNAKAFTVDNNIYFNDFQYRPETHEGKRLLAHELTHTLQQGTSTIKRTPAKTDTQATTDSTPPAAPKQTGLNRTLYVVQNDVWKSLPVAVRTGAENELNRVFAFVGKTAGEKPFTIKILSSDQLPEQFDFSESIVSVIQEEVGPYLDNAFALQQKQINDWLTTQKVPVGTTASQPREARSPELIGRGGQSKHVIKEGANSFAIPQMAGAVDIREVVKSFLDNIDSLLNEQMVKLPGNGTDISKWPATVTSKRGTTSWNPLEMLGPALGRAIAHEARHEYIGGAHSETGLGKDSAFIIGEKNSENFSDEDQKTIITKLHGLEKDQGNATVVPTFSRSSRSKKDQFPF